MVDIFIEPVALMHAVNIKLILALKLLESRFNVLLDQRVYFAGFHVGDCPDTELPDQSSGDRGSRSRSGLQVLYAMEAQRRLSPSTYVSAILTVLKAKEPR